MTRPSEVTEPYSPLVLRRLDRADDSAFDDLLRLYQEAFPDSERKPAPWLRRMLADKNYHFLLASEAEGLATVGFAIARVLDGNTATLLEYMTIAPFDRGRGLGRRLVLAAAQALPLSARTLLAEVESDRTEGPDQALRTRRKLFYRSSGARELQHLRWIMPTVASAPPPAMEMMVLNPNISSVSKDQLRRWLTSIYVEVYEQSADDPRIEAMLAALPDAVELI